MGAVLVSAVVLGSTSEPKVVTTSQRSCRREISLKIASPWPKSPLVPTSSARTMRLGICCRRRRASCPRMGVPRRFVETITAIIARERLEMTQQSRNESDLDLPRPVVLSSCRGPRGRYPKWRIKASGIIGGQGAGTGAGRGSRGEGMCLLLQPSPSRLSGRKRQSTPKGRSPWMIVRMIQREEGRS